VEDLTGEEEFGEEASPQSSALEEGDTVCFKMAHGDIVTRVGKMTYGVVAENVPQDARRVWHMHPTGRNYIHLQHSTALGRKTPNG
jgi:hypothetical protein